MRKAKIFAAMLMAMSSLGAFAQHQFMVQANKPGVEIQPTMYGIFSLLIDGYTNESSLDVLYDAHESYMLDETTKYADRKSVV